MVAAPMDAMGGAPAAIVALDSEPAAEATPMANLPMSEPRRVEAMTAEVAAPALRSPAEPPAARPAAAEPSVAMPYVLPLASLHAVAAASGLAWINSDADKARAVQDAMAREPQPVHVPRERPPLVRNDEGPLVLVETRKDLSQIKLPFETSEAG
jgi:ribonuclease E